MEAVEHLYCLLGVGLVPPAECNDSQVGITDCKLVKKGVYQDVSDQVEVDVEDGGLTRQSLSQKFDLAEVECLLDILILVESVLIVIPVLLLGLEGHTASGT